MTNLTYQEKNCFLQLPVSGELLFYTELLRLQKKTVTILGANLRYSRLKGLLKIRQKEKMKTLKDVKVGETVKVIRVQGSGPVRRRIMDMGITKGVEIYVRKVAPLGDPMELSLRGYELTLRKADAVMVEIEEA